MNIFHLNEKIKSQILSDRGEKSDTLGDETNFFLLQYGVFSIFQSQQPKISIIISQVERVNHWNGAK